MTHPLCRERRIPTLLPVRRRQRSRTVTLRVRLVEWRILPWWTLADIWRGRHGHGGLLGSIYVLTGADWARRILHRRYKRTHPSV